MTTKADLSSFLRRSGPLGSGAERSLLPSSIKSSFPRVVVGNPSLPSFL
ncbi:MAG: hypothetical protein SOY93_05790 [Elusimicrobiaceae bacterium]|nr:hypothetical protein [Elusimicrobiaceae bacterium]